MMSHIVIFCIACAVSLAALVSGQMSAAEKQELVLQCIAETKVDEAKLLADLRNQNVNDQGVKCWWTCLAKKRGIFTADGQVNRDRVLNGIRDGIPADVKERIKQQFAGCIELSGADECETGYLVTKCMSNARP